MEPAWANKRNIDKNEARDERIQKCVTDRLVHDARYPALLDVMVEVKDGSVTLSGTVPHRVMKQSIEEMAAGCPGVTRVENYLQVALTAPWPDLAEGRAVDIKDKT